MRTILRDSEVEGPKGGGGAPESEGGKALKRFNTAVTKLSAILEKEPDKKGRKKVPASKMEEIVKNLFKADEEALAAEVSAELKKLLEDYVKMHSEFDKKEKELQKLKDDKMKEFAEAGEKLFNKIDGLPDLEKKYAEAMTKLAGGSTT